MKMTEIKFDKKSAYIFEIGNFFFGIVIFTIILLALGLFMSGGSLVFSWVLYGYLIISGLSTIYKLLKIYSLKYLMGKGKLYLEYTVITHRIDTARLQVINSVDINQTVVGRLFGIYSVKIRYGFSEEGYVFEYSYFDKKTAKHIAEKVEPLGKELRLR